MSEWRPIETAPKDGTRIQLGFENMRGFNVIAHWTDGGWSAAGTGQHAIYLHGRPPPTHWMPLTDPPFTTRAGEKHE